MGHGDEIVFGDANFPANSTCTEGAIAVNASGHNITDLLPEVLKLFPLDQYVYNPAMVMDMVNSDKNKGMEVAVWKDYQSIVDTAHGSHVEILAIERFEFYERAKKAYAVVATGEPAPYGNIILKKGVIAPP